jgi:hypothetical protein
MSLSCLSDEGYFINKFLVKKIKKPMEELVRNNNCPVILKQKNKNLIFKTVAFNLNLNIY